MPTTLYVLDKQSIMFACLGWLPLTSSSTVSIFQRERNPTTAWRVLGYEPGGVFLPQGEFSTLFFSETPMSLEHFLLVLQSGDWGVCEL